MYNDRHGVEIKSVKTSEHNNHSPSSQALILFSFNHSFDVKSWKSLVSVFCTIFFALFLIPSSSFVCQLYYWPWFCWEKLSNQNLKMLVLLSAQRKEGTCLQAFWIIKILKYCGAYHIVILFIRYPMLCYALCLTMLSKDFIMIIICNTECQFF